MMYQCKLYLFDMLQKYGASLNRITGQGCVYA